MAVMTNKIQQTALFNPGMQGLQLAAKVQLRLDGQVQSVALAQSSGNDSFDRLAVNAVLQSSAIAASRGSGNQSGKWHRLIL